MGNPLKKDAREYAKVGAPGKSSDDMAEVVWRFRYTVFLDAAVSCGMHDVFISHAKADKAIADMVCATLEQQGLRCWIAPRDIRPGTDWSGAIVEAIRGSRAMVLVFSDHANGSRHIPRELERAIDREIPIIPFRIENVLPRGPLEYSLSSVHWLDAVTPPVEAHIRGLGQLLLTVLDLQPVGPVTPEEPRSDTKSKTKPDELVSAVPVARRSPRGRNIAIAAAVILAIFALVWLGLGPGDRPNVDRTLSHFKIGIVNDAGGTNKLDPASVLTERDVKSINLSVVSGESNNEPAVHFQFTEDGASRMQALTSANIGKRMGFELDNGEVVQSAIIQSPVFANAQLSFHSIEEANAFILKLEAKRK